MGIADNEPDEAGKKLVDETKGKGERMLLPLINMVSGGTYEG